MARVLACDGCGQPRTELARIGRVIEREFCTVCAEKAAAYLADLDALHAQVALDWSRRLAELRARYQSQGFGEFPC